jgi:hypothetical protein
VVEEWVAGVSRVSRLRPSARLWGDLALTCSANLWRATDAENGPFEDRGRRHGWFGRQAAREGTGLKTRHSEAGSEAATGLARNLVGSRHESRAAYGAE